MKTPQALRLTIGRRLLLIFGLQFLAIAALGAYGFISMWRTARGAQVSVSQAVDSVTQAQEMYLAATAATQILAAQAAAGTADVSGIEPLRDRFREASRKLAAHERGARQATDAQKLFSGALTQGEAQVRAAAGQQWVEAGAAGRAFAAATSALIAGLEKIRTDESASMQTELTSAREATVRRAVTFVVGIVLSIAFGSLLALQLRARVAKPIERLAAVAARIAEDGDLTQPLPAAGNDEVGDLAVAFETMMVKLKDVLRALHESVQLLGNAGTELSQSTTAQGQTLTRQAAALQETQVTAQEIKQTSLLAATKAESVLALTEKAEAASSGGEQAIEQSLTGLTDIRAQVNEIAQKISQLSTRTQQISGITQTVKDLADQSNMLALNAAIEAVRSGEHGKGFAVVAREIRSLADQSIDATNRVREILADIGGAIQVAVNITGAGTTKIERGLLQIKQSGGNMRELSGIVRENLAAVRQIAAAVSQQNAGVTQIFGALTDQTQMMDETMKRLETTTRSAAVLQELSQRVSEVARRFKV